MLPAEVCPPDNPWRTSLRDSWLVPSATHISRTHVFLEQTPGKTTQILEALFQLAFPLVGCSLGNVGFIISGVGGTWGDHFCVPLSWWFELFGI